MITTKIVNKKLINRPTAILIAILFIFFFEIKITEAKSFEINLYFNKETRQISFDKDSADKIAVSPELLTMKDIRENEQESEYYFKMLSLDAKELARANFIPEQGRFKLTLPYYNTIYKIELYNKDSLLLSIDTGSFASCNLNNICESAKGEDAQNCIADCFAGEVEKVKNKSPIDLEPGTPLTGGNSNTNTSTPTTPTKTPILGLIVGLIMITGGIGYGVYRFIQRYRGDE